MAKHCFDGKDPDFDDYWRSCYADEHYIPVRVPSGTLLPVAHLCPKFCHYASGAITCQTQCSYAYDSCMPSCAEDLRVTNGVCQVRSCNFCLHTLGSCCMEVGRKETG